jgi:hypothetical protein
MNDKFGRDDRFRNDRFRNDRERDDRYRSEPLSEDRYGEERWLRSPEHDFETSPPYRQPHDESWRRPRGGWGFDSFAQRGRGARYEGSYAPSPYVPSREARGGYAGRGPKGYARSDERIREDVCDRLSWDDEIDATDITVVVAGGEVTLEGNVTTRHMKRLGEDIAEQVPGVVDVHNRLRVTKPVLTELREKILGQDQPEHFANTGTKTSSTHGAPSRNGVT